MALAFDKLEVAQPDREIAMSLLSALIGGWQFLPPASQARIVRDACLVKGEDGLLRFPDEVLAFIDANKPRGGL